MILISISGGAGAGKSTLAEALKTAYESTSKTTSIIPLDSYYHSDGIHGQYIVRNEQRFLDMNHPDSIDIDNVQDLIATADSDILIIEGLFPLAISTIRQRLALSIYIDVPADIRLGRKIIRKLEEQQIPPQIVFRNYLDTVRGRHFEFIEPCKEFADILIDGTTDTETQVNLITKQLDLNTKKE